MRWKTTVALLIATVGVGAYISLYELKRPSPEEARRLASQVVRVSPEDVTSLLIELPQTQVTLERKNGSWRLINPLAGRAEESLVRRILNELDPLEAEQVLEGSTEKPLALGDYGLEPPQGSVTLIAGSRATKLLIGHPTAVGDNRYIKLPDSPKVYVASARLFDALDQPLASYRSHELLAFDTWKASEIRLMSPRTSWMLTKQSDQWQVVKPIVDQADPAATSTILSKLRGLRIERFVTDPAAPPLAESARGVTGGAGAPQVEQLPEWGFEAPSAQITLALGEGIQPLELYVGDPTKDNPEQLYAKRADEPTIYAVAKSSIDELLQDPQALRSHACFEFFASQVTKVSLTWQETSWTIEKVNDQWQLAEGQPALDASQVEEFLWKLHDVKLTRFVEDPAASGAGALQDLTRYGLDPPRGRIQVWVTDKPEPEELLIGEAIDQGTTRYGQIIGRASVVELPKAINDILKTTPDSFQAQPEPSSS